MSTISNRLFALGLVLLAEPVGAIADSVTYDFTGTVFISAGIYSSAAVGSTITGTFTIDIANGIPSQSRLPVSTSSYWYSQEMTGSFWGLPPSNAYVFSSTAQDGSVSYQTDSTALAYNSQSIAQDNCGGGTSGCEYNGYESDSASIGILTFSQINLFGTLNTIDGLPVLSGPLNATGHFGTANGDGVDNELWYNLTSIAPTTPVPLPATVWLLLSALGGLGAMGRRGARLAAS